jgi:hypothetical protein
MWKDFFYFSRGQRTGIIVLIVLIAVVLAINFSLPYVFPVSNPSGASLFFFLTKNVLLRTFN